MGHTHGGRPRRRDRELRQQRGVTQEEVAEWIGAHRNDVGQLERGDVSTQLTRLLAKAAPDLVGTALPPPGV
jgi:DNA-binding XRE family transcriptional regulator